MTRIREIFRREQRYHIISFLHVFDIILNSMHANILRYITTLRNKVSN